MPSFLSSLIKCEREKLLTLINAFPHEYSRFGFPDDLRKAFFENNNLVSLRKIKAAIIDFEVNQIMSQLKMSGTTEVPIEHVIAIQSQVAIQRILCSSALARAYFLSILMSKPLLYALPEKWMPFFREHGVEVNAKACRILRFLDQLRDSGKNFARYLLTALINLKLGISSREMPVSGELVYFHTINKSNVDDQEAGRFFTLTNWFKKHVLEIDSSTTRIPFAKQISCTYEFKPFCSYPPKKEFAIFVWSLKKTFELCSEKQIEVGHAAFLFSELANLRRCNVSRLTFNAIVFNASSGIVKPLWVHYFESKKIPVYFAFYTSWLEPEHLTGEVSHSPLWSASTWSRVFTYDEYQLEKLRRDSVIPSSPSYRHIGGPWWADDKLTEIQKDEKIVVFFDNATSPHHVGDIITEEYGFRSSKYQIELLESVVNTAIASGFRVLHKTKRSLKGAYQDRDYLLRMKRLGDEFGDKYTLIKRPVSVERLSLVSTAVIAFPFSSSAIQAKSLTRNVVFYDPSGLVRLSDSSLRGIQLIINEERLSNWLRYIKK
jgi:polysaccharide biosynthesis PFTS motif protein